MPPAKNVVLVGPMGAGKTTIGRTLADRLGYAFFDTDTLIEERTGADIAWIFDVEGEEGFRERETALLRELGGVQRTVFATGGGMVLKPENRRLLAGLGAVVYLETTVEQQLARTRRDTKRPLLRTPDRERVLRELLAARDPLYREVADLVIPTDRRSARTVVDTVVEWMQGDDRSR